MQYSIYYINSSLYIYYIIENDYCIFISGFNEPLPESKEPFQYHSYHANFDQYFCENQPLDIPYIITGTPFEQKVHNELLKIPYGKTVTYQYIAKMINHPNSARAVANAIGKNQLPILIPCHRVIRSDGSMGGYKYGSDMKKWLLKHEKNNIISRN